MLKKIDTSLMKWRHKPLVSLVHRDYVIIATQPYTDMWQKTYFNVEKVNAPALLLPIRQNFSFKVKVESNYQKKHDQAGVLVYVDDLNWAKIAVAYHNESYSFLSTVVTVDGRSDWSSVKLSSDIAFMHYRLSHLDGVFRVENSLNGNDFRQMRVFTMPCHEPKYQIGIYACSPLDSSFEAHFSQMFIGDCQWKPYIGDIR
ncbi:MAG: DUF1349 domain-containing protein [Erysipelotrichaceae bacterium]|nr:DUF1349 domain-containing protein [Erysipelotrichaceae bacterium]MDY5252009.1 DUF1349 domain-containing protein [Erysipelotrichaceae bacterium]